MLLSKDNVKHTEPLKSLQKYYVCFNNSLTVHETQIHHGSSSVIDPKVLITLPATQLNHKENHAHWLNDDIELTQLHHS